MTQPAPDQDDLMEAHTSVDIAAHPEQVWDAITTPEGLAQWMGTGATLDPTQQGRLHFPDPVGGRRRSGEVDHARADQHQLRFTWWPDEDPDHQSSVTITVLPTDQGSRVVVTEVAPAASVVSASASMVSGGQWAWRVAVLKVAVLKVALAVLVTV